MHLIPITQFRKDIFEIVNQAMEGHEVWVTHKGRRFRIAPETTSGSRLSRITPLNVINTESDFDEQSIQREMIHAWESDWSTL